MVLINNLKQSHYFIFQIHHYEFLLMNIEDVEDVVYRTTEPVKIFFQKNAG
jgi:hypothetical protein